MPAFNDLTGRTFGRLTVLRLAPRVKRTRWVCLCRCGSETVVSASELTTGGTRSCGCIKREKAGAINRTHGRSNSPEYVSWTAMINRCTNPNTPNYATYGGRGIWICPRWRNSFEAFLADMGPRPSAEHTIDRIDVNGGYEPANCRWATRLEQAQNKRPYPKNRRPYRYRTKRLIEEAARDMIEARDEETLEAAE